MSNRQTFQSPQDILQQEGSIGREATRQVQAISLPDGDRKTFPTRCPYLGFLSVVGPVCQGLYPLAGLA